MHRVSIDVTSSFLLTSIPQGRGFPVLALTPPRLLARLGLAEEGKLWILAHAVCGLTESPRLWSDFEDCQLRALRCVVDGVGLQLNAGSKLVACGSQSDAVVVAGLLTYVDDFLLALKSWATVIQSIWKTTPLAAESQLWTRVPRDEFTRCLRFFSNAQGLRFFCNSSAPTIY